MASSQSDIVERIVEVQIEEGLHMRPAMQFVDKACNFKSQVTITNGDKHVDGKSIMQVTMLAATKGTKLTIVTQGPDALVMMDTLVAIIENNEINN